MIEDKNIKHRNVPNGMSDAEIMFILILFYFGASTVSSITTRYMSVNI